MQNKAVLTTHSQGVPSLSVPQYIYIVHHYSVFSERRIKTSGMANTAEEKMSVFPRPANALNHSPPHSNWHSLKT